MLSTPTPSRRRQRQACQECRRRKLRCDGRQPRCSSCENIDTQCDVDPNRKPRGPKKGYLIALQNKIETLEDRLRQQEQHHLKWPDNLEYGDEMLDTIASHTTATLAGLEDARLPTDTDLLTMRSTPLVSESDASLSSYFDVNMVSTTMALLQDHTPTTSLSEYISNSLHITDPMKTELDQLYFDRIHAAVPILHQRRYLSWSKLPDKTRSRTCLQHAVWATASLMSPQFQHLQDKLYSEVKRLLATTTLVQIPGGQGSVGDVELVQAWVLRTTYEFIKMNRYETSLSAAYTFRLAQLIGLHKVDVLNNLPSNCEIDFITTEEKRRAFWMAFILETLSSIHSNLPLVVNEHMICTRLPVPDHEFQNGQPVCIGFLHELLSKRSQTVKSPLNECIMLAALCARISFHAQQHNKYLLHNQADYDSLEWRKPLYNALALRLQTLEEDYPSQKHSSDPALLFANFLAQASILYLWGNAQSLEWQNGSPSRSNSLNTEFQQLAFGAAQRIVELARSLLDFPLSKIHPFTPIPLCLGVKFLSANSLDSIAAPLQQELLDVIRRLSSASNVQQSYIDISDIYQDPV
ncbi:hypothetical protein N5P37_004835 [Trichoderma harzianum]|nr:hypothetical protein N5P37_004835 [Trichoderma harzianum]PKK50758.1 hypothetical protein CI102_4357 [Trichoderma harzianum]